MRVAPAGLCYCDDLEKTRKVASSSAEITHTHDLGREGAVIQAYAVALALRTEPAQLDPSGFLQYIAGFTESKVYRKKLEKAIDLLNRDDRREVIASLGNTVEALYSVPTAIYCFTKNCQNYAKAVLYAVSLGGDTDTIGAMTGAIAGAYHAKNKLPNPWKQKLEKAAYIKDLAKRLWKLSRKETKL